MKKLYFILFALIIGNSAFAQTIANAGMESWRTNTAGGISGDTTVTIYAPVNWYGFDTLVISLGETFGGFISAGNDWNAQLFPDSVVKHSGNFSAKLITVDQDVLGNIPSVLSNAQPSINTAELMATENLSQSTTFSGGTPVTDRIGSVSAWVQYNLDSVLLGGATDTATLTVLVYAKVTVGSVVVDSVVGSDTLYIYPTSSWTQVTANIKYTDSLNGADTVRILFSSSNIAAEDSSTLNVDDVSMVYAPPLAVKNVIAQNDIKVYPNPTSGMLYIKGAQNTEATFQLSDMSGQIVATKTYTGSDAMDISYLPDGLYFYTITNVNSNTTQHGKVSVVR